MMYLLQVNIDASERPPSPLTFHDDRLRLSFKKLVGNGLKKRAADRQQYAASRQRTPRNAPSVELPPSVACLCVILRVIWSHTYCIQQWRQMESGERERNEYRDTRTLYSGFRLRRRSDMVVPRKVASKYYGNYYGARPIHRRSMTALRQNTAQMSQFQHRRHVDQWPYLR
jgi:hypothetical protein